MNGIAVFAKGSNMIPASVFEDQVSDSDLKWLLEQAADANMNMLRVWGGGRYQRDAFYDMADAMGLLIWQVLIATDGHGLPRFATDCNGLAHLAGARLCLRHVSC